MISLKKKNGVQEGEPTRRQGEHDKKPNGRKLSSNGKPLQLDSVAIAKSWLQLGIRPVPLGRRSKKPVAGKGWNKMRVTEETIDQFFYRGYNVGGLWGSPSGWVVDVDLDTEEACLAAPRYLPETFVYGRKSAPGSHYLYRCEGAETKKYLTSEHGMIAEIRSTGSQSVLPPSVHPSGETYDIYHDTDFTRIPRIKLYALLRRISAAALVAIRWPAAGSRHDFLVALIGSLCWSGWPAGEIKVFGTAVLDAVQSEDEDREKHERTINNVIKNYKEGNHTQGWSFLSQWFSGDNLTKLKEWIGLNNAEGDTPPDDVGEDQLGIDPKLLEVPGLVGEVTKWAAKRSFFRQPIFELAVGLSVVALASRNNYIVDYWETPLQPYFLLIAPTASGKDDSMTAVFMGAHKAGLKEHVFKGFQSYHALLDRLAAPPSIAHINWDEFARKLKSAARSTGGADYAVLTYLLELYGKAASSIPGLPARKNSIQAIDYPFLSILAAAQPEHLLEALTESELQLGLVNRFILLDSEIKSHLNDQRDSTFPQVLEEKLLKFQAIKRPQTSLPFRKVHFENQEVKGLFQAFFLKSQDSAASGGTSEIFGRAAQNALICAGIVAVGMNMDRPIITAPIANWAIEFITWSAQQWVRRVEQSSAKNATERSSKYVERLVVHAKQHMSRARGEPERALVRKGLLPKSMLMRMSRYLRGRELDETLTSLLLADLIATGEVEGRICYWPKRVRTLKKL